MGLWVLIAQFKTTLPHGACLHSSAVVALGPGGPWPSGPWPVSLWRTPSPAVLNQRANRVTRETAHACHVRTSSVLGEGKAGVERARELEGYGGPARSGAVRSEEPSGGRHAAPRDPRWTPLGLCRRTLVDRRGRHEVAPAPPGGLHTGAPVALPGSGRGEAFSGDARTCPARTCVCVCTSVTSSR